MKTKSANTLVQSLYDPDKCKFESSLLDRSTTRVTMEAEVAAPSNMLFELLADPRQHVDIFDAIEGADCRLLEQDGAKCKWLLDYKARWRFWKVTGVCENKLHMWTDRDKGTVTFKLREPGFLRLYEGTWTILPATKGNTASHLPRSGHHVASGSSMPTSMLAAIHNPFASLPKAASSKAMADELEVSPSNGYGGSSIIRVEKIMSPKVSPPFPLNQTLKGHAIGQVQDMLKGLLAAAKELDLSSSPSTSAGSLVSTFDTSSRTSRTDDEGCD